MSSIYRKKSLDRLSSPEQLDRMIVITPPLVWLAVAAGFVLIMFALSWAIFGSVYSTISCESLYFDKGDPSYLYAPVSGLITECNVSKDSSFEKGDILFKITDDSGNVTRIAAPVSGYTDSFQRTGYYASTGTELLRYWGDNYQDGGYVYCLVPFSQAGAVQEGMEVMFYPDYLDTQHFGHLTGTVEKIENLPVSSVDLYYQIGNEMLIDEIAAGGPYVAMYCSLDKDSSSENGYLWTNENGGSVLMTNEMPMVTEVIVSRKSPLSLLIG